VAERYIVPILPSNEPFVDHLARLQSGRTAVTASVKLVSSGFEAGVSFWPIADMPSSYANVRF
jgi:hypothetical protein